MAADALGLPADLLDRLQGVPDDEPEHPRQDREDGRQAGNPITAAASIDSWTSSMDTATYTAAGPSEVATVSAATRKPSSASTPGSLAGDDDTPITGPALEQATAAALAHTGGGEVTETEVDDGADEVEVIRPDGTEVEVELDERFTVVGSETEADDDDDDDDDAAEDAAEADGQDTD